MQDLRGRSTSEITCPKCATTQPFAEECRGCGVIFDKIKPSPSQAEETIDPVPATTAPGALKRTLRILRWVFLSTSLFVLFLMLKPAPLPPPRAEKGAARSSALKMSNFRRSVEAGRPAALALAEDEVNVWLDQNLALPSRPAQTESSLESSPERTGEDEPEPTLEEVQGAVRELEIVLSGETIRTSVWFNLYGKEMSFEIEGRLRAENGYIVLDPTRGRLGSLPLPAFSLQTAVHRVMNSPENREKFRLPSGVKDICVQDSTLIVSVDPTAR